MDLYLHLIFIFISVMVCAYNTVALLHESCCKGNDQICNGNISLTCDGNKRFSLMNISIYICSGGNTNYDCSCDETNSTPCLNSGSNSIIESGISSCNSMTGCTITDTLCTNGGVKLGRVVIDYTCTLSSTPHAAQTSLEETKMTNVPATASKTNGTTTTQQTQNSSLQANSMMPSFFISSTSLLKISHQLSDESFSQTMSPTGSERNTDAETIEPSVGYLSISVTINIPIERTQKTLLSTEKIAHIFFTNLASSVIAAPSATLSAASSATIASNKPANSSHEETTAYSSFISPTTSTEVSSSLFASTTSYMPPEEHNNTKKYESDLSSLGVTLGVSLPVAVILIIVIVLFIFLRWRKRAVRKKQYKSMLHHALFNIDYNAQTDVIAMENPMASVDNDFSDYSEISKDKSPGDTSEEPVENGEYNTINLKSFAVRSDPTYGHLSLQDDEIDTTYNSVSRKPLPMVKDDTYAHIGRSYHQAKREKIELEDDLTYNTLGDTGVNCNGFLQNVTETGDNVYDHASNVTQEKLVSVNPDSTYNTLGDTGVKCNGLPKIVSETVENVYGRTSNISEEKLVSVKPGETLFYDEVEIGIANDGYSVDRLEGQNDEEVNAKISQRNKENTVEVIPEEKELDDDTNAETNNHEYFILEKLPLETDDPKA